MLSAFIKQNKLPEKFKYTVENYYKPLAQRIVTQFKNTNEPYFVGVNGCQGSGKSTLTDFIAQYLSSQYQVSVVTMSLDDFYFSSEIRNQLGLNIHPLLSTRGVPGTHDMAALALILTRLSRNETGFSIPRFNKATDEPYPEKDWSIIEEPVDIIILEGWCWGVKPQTSEQLRKPINELEFMHDEDGIWRYYVNEQLKESYEPLYEKMNFWLSLQAPSFNCVYKWRLEQEQKLADKNIGKSPKKIMSYQEISNFTLYFQRLTEQGFKTIPQLSDAIFFLDDERNIFDMLLKHSTLSS